MFSLETCANDILINSKVYNIPENWIKSIIMQESAGKRYALRYEASYGYLFHPEIYAKKLGITLNTEIQSQKFSYGLGQLMGAVLREQGHEGPMGEVYDPSLNIKHITIRLNLLRKRTENVDAIFAGYNGGFGAMMPESGIFHNQAYVDSIKKHLQSFA